MFILILSCRVPGVSASQTFRGLIAAASEGDAPDYQVSLLNERLRPCARALLPRYPRWAEPVTALLARALDVALRARPDCLPRLGITSAELAVVDSRTQQPVERVLFGAAPRGARHEVPFSQPDYEAENPWQVMRWACAHQAFGSQVIPPLPPKLRPPIYESGGMLYCRTSDFPLAARVTFERLQSRLSRPFVPSVPDAVYPWWVDAFVRNELPGGLQRQEPVWP